MKTYQIREDQLQNLITKVKTALEVTKDSQSHSADPTKSFPYATGFSETTFIHILTILELIEKYEQI